jgi:hypothetical protein
MKMDRANSNRPAATFNPSSATYHDDLHKAGFISDAQLAAAHSGDRSEADAAYVQVLSLLTFAAERPLTRKQSKAIHSGPQVSIEDLHTRQRERDALLRAKYLAKGYRFENSRVADHNCLITSILQHVTKDFTTNHSTLAHEYREKLNNHLQRNLTPAQKKKFAKNDLLDAYHADWLLKELAKDPRFKNHDLIVELWVADDKGEPVRFTFGEGKTSVIIFNSTDHFEAVTLPLPSAPSANSATATRSSTSDSTKKQGQNANTGLEYFYATQDPLKQEIDTM